MIPFEILHPKQGTRRILFFYYTFNDNSYIIHTFYFRFYFMPMPSLLFE